MVPWFHLDVNVYKIEAVTSCVADCLTVRQKSFVRKIMVGYLINHDLSWEKKKDYKVQIFSFQWIPKLWYILIHIKSNATSNLC
jgi:hypothetical protein